MAKDTPKWGSKEFLEAIEEHDKEADPKRKDAGHKYTEKPAEKKKGK